MTTATTPIGDRIALILGRNILEIEGLKEQIRSLQQSLSQKMEEELANALKDTKTEAPDESRNARFDGRKKDRSAAGGGTGVREGGPEGRTPEGKK